MLYLQEGPFNWFVYFLLHITLSLVSLSRVAAAFFLPPWARTPSMYPSTISYSKQFHLRMCVIHFAFLFKAVVNMDLISFLLSIFYHAWPLLFFNSPQTPHFNPFQVNVHPYKVQYHFTRFFLNSRFNLVHIRAFLLVNASFALIDPLLHPVSNSEIIKFKSPFESFIRHKKPTEGSHWPYSHVKQLQDEEKTWPR